MRDAQEDQEGEIRYLILTSELKYLVLSTTYGIFR
jgi:hypothetical protein